MPKKSLIETTYLHESRKVLFWDHGDGAKAAATVDHGTEVSAELHLPGGREEVTGVVLEAGDSAEALVQMDSADLTSDSARVLQQCASLILDMIARESFLPCVEGADPEDRDKTGLVLGWALNFDDIDDRRHRLALERAMPAVFAAADPKCDTAALIDAFFRDATDSLIRRAAPIALHRSGWVSEFAEQLGGTMPSVWHAPNAELARELRVWLPEPETTEIWTAHAQLHAPDAHNTWTVTFELISENSGVARTVAEVLATGTRNQRETVERAASLITSLVGVAESGAAPGPMILDPTQAWRFISASRRSHGQYGAVRLHVPDSVVAVGPGGLELRLHAALASADESGSEPAERPAARIADTDLNWEVRVGNNAIEDADLERLKHSTEPLVNLQGRWLALDPADFAHLKSHLERPKTMLAPAELIVAVLDGSLSLDDAFDAEVVASGEVAELARALRGPQLCERAEPDGLQTGLRHYQARGLDWLCWLEDNHLGGILADDMGLGKGVQAIGLMLERPAATLVVCPTSVLGNWEHELHRFAPTADVIRHHGADRSGDGEDLASRVGKSTVVLTTYAILRRDTDVLGKPDWQRILLDEAQHIKNPDSDTARAARTLGSTVDHRLCLTGTPVENHIGELWSILEFANPGMLGGNSAFKQRFGTPIARGDDTAARRLRQVTAPFVLRRTKNDPAIAPDLPDKHETALYCSLTPDQARLYEDTTKAALQEISSSDGMKRRGRILALITKLKQICDHPNIAGPEITGAEITGPNAPARPEAQVNASGKLAHLVEMLEEVRSCGDRSIVFTQYVAMGKILADVVDAPFYHGGLRPKERDELVRNFQSAGDSTTDDSGVLIVSLKAGGLGLNLTAANRVFHYDRWWNPAVEDQATDRTHRIGQTRDVWVHKLICMGTLEERIDERLASKRALAESVVGEGESWLTELNDSELEALVKLERSAIL